MAEDKNAPERGAEGFGAGADPAAMALALGSASQAKADRFLEVQTALAGDQRHHLHAQLLPAISEKWLGVFLRLATAFVGMAVAGGLSLLVWQAARSDGLRVESFSVPPDLAARGLTGEVVATRVIDRLSELQTQTNTARSARSYSNTWGAKTIKLEIPETGISLQELDSWLREKVGHETSLTGEVVRTATGVTLTARAGEDGAVSISGAEAEMDTLTGKLAEAIYRITQPYRYATWLYRHENRPADARPIFKELALNGSPDDRAWSYNMWAQTETAVSGGDSDVGVRWYRQAVTADPEGIGAYTGLAGSLNNLGRTEEAVQIAREWYARLGDGKQIYVPADQIPAAKSRVQSQINRYMGAYGDALPVDAPYLKTGLAGFGIANLLGIVITDQSGAHDLSAASRSLAEFPAGAAADRIALMLAFLAEDWSRALGLGDAMAAFLKATPRDRHYAIVAYSPRLALAQAHLGDFAAAERTIAPTPADCYPCLIARAQIAELRGQRERAEFWFTKATAAGPSLPFAFEAEGRALLGRGQPDQAIERFTIAGQKTPHFADALQGWGEALMAKNQSHLALAKFKEAEKYAPNWGRLHLKWGEALFYAGKKDEAKTHFARAAALDLTPSEKAELAKVSHV